MPHAVIPGFLNWTLAFNTGAAFSFLADQPGWQRWLFTALAIVVSAVLVRWLRARRARDWRTALPLALVIGGALGNLIDRLRFGHVTDFIQVYYQQWSFPVVQCRRFGDQRRRGAAWSGSACSRSRTKSAGERPRRRA